MKSKKYREYNPSQVMLLPPSLHDWLNSDHLVYFVMDLVKQLDLSAIEDGISVQGPAWESPLRAGDDGRVAHLRMVCRCPFVS